MYNRLRWLALLGGVVLCAGCTGGKTPEQIEAEKRRADEAFAAQSAAAEFARERNQERLVRQQLAEHEAKSRIEDERAAQAVETAESEDQKRLLDLVRASFVEPSAVQFGGVRWNARRDALCGEVSADTPDGTRGPSHGFVVSDDGSLIDSENESQHERFSAAAAQYDCEP